MAMMGCQQVPYHVIDNYIYVQKEGRENTEWQLIWEDHFDGGEIDTYSARWS